MKTNRHIMGLLGKLGLAVILSTIMLMIFSGACSTPCNDLAGAICGCESTSLKQATCRNTFIAGNPVNISSEQQSQCSILLGTCTCDALDAGNYAACGLAYIRDF